MYRAVELRQGDVADVWVTFRKGKYTKRYSPSLASLQRLILFYTEASRKGLLHKLYNGWAIIAR